MMPSYYKLIFLIYWCWLTPAAFGQAMINNTQVSVSDGGVMIVKGTVMNIDSLSNSGNLYVDSHFVNNGNATGGGKYFITGDWENNLLFIADTSTVELNGGDQRIKGTSISNFYDLTLSGSGIKTMDLDASAANVLALNDRELHSNTFTFSVLSTNLNAILSASDSGFVSSDNGGYLSRAMQNSGAYWYPLGSSDTTWRYRPIDITPENANQQVIKVRFANTNATNEGYSTSSLDTTLCTVNPDYYHQINRTMGTDSVGITIYYDNATDINGELIAQWQTSANWSSTGSATTVSNTSPVLSSLAKFYWNDFSELAFAAATKGFKTTLSASTVQCVDDTSGQAMVTISGGVAPYTYQWNDGQSTSTASGLGVGTYSVAITDAVGCVKVDSVTVSAVSPATINFTGDTAFCSGTSATVIATLNGATPDAFIWSTGDTTSSITILPASTTSYEVTASYGLCSVTDSVTLTMNNPPNAQIIADTSACVGEIVQLTADPSPGSTYLWSTGETTSEIVLLLNANTDVYLTVTNNCGIAEDTVNIAVSSVSASVSNDTTIFAGSEVTLNGTGGLIYEWIPDTYLDNSDVQSPTSTPDETITYLLIVTDGNGCSDTVQVTVTVEIIDDLGVPNVFSPNGDGENDYVFVHGVNYGIEFLEFIIYDRWGEKVFESTCCCSSSCGWDGVFRGKEMNSAVFVYTLRASMHGELIQKHGNITLVR